SCSQIELAQLYYANSNTDVELEQPLPVTLEFREVDGWVLLPASVNGKPQVDFVLDTGASMLALLAGEQSKALDLDMSAAKRLGDADDLAAPTGAPQAGLDIDFGPLTLLDQTALAIPVETIKCSAEVRDAPFVGVVGHELLSRYVVAIDYDRHEVVLHDPETYEYRGDGRVVHADISGRQPFVDAAVTAPDGAQYTARMHVDSGAGIVASLFPSTNAAIVPPKDGKEKSACFVGGKATYLTGTSVDMSLGGGPAVTTPVEYATGREVIDTGQNGRLGAQFLRNYNVIFDYSRERMILEPRAASIAAR
ncbi:MAG TPA: hypothetical protein VFL14_01915, partial [Xanthomonadales bacterium]|nr:hypothetical protein [Xanthomonadales bacterium]